MHDKNGKPIKVGDKVVVEGVITSANGGDEYCNVTLGIGHDQEHGPHNVRGSLTLNAKQVELVESAAE